jgi:nucleotide-binding universal stress UspA family protein
VSLWVPKSERSFRRSAGCASRLGWRDVEKEVVSLGNKDKPILVGIDGSALGSDALRWALAEAEQRDCRVRALMVYRSASTTGRRPGRRFLGYGGDTIDSGYGRLMSRAITAAVGEAVQPRLTAELVSGVAQDELTLASAHAQLVVLGGRGSGRPSDSRASRLTGHLLRHAVCPVVVVPAAAVARQPERRNGRVGQRAVTYGTGPMF